MTTPPDEPTLDLEPTDAPAPAEPAPAEEPAPAPKAPADYDTAREQLAAQINLDHQDVAGLSAYPYIFQPENVPGGKAAAAVYREKLTNTSQANVLRHELVIDLYVAGTDGIEVEAEADDYLDLLLLSIERTPGLTWSEAERTNWAGDYAGYRVRAGAHSADVYASTIRAENAAAAADSGN